MSPPKITVVVPSYNQGEFLAEALDSVLNQEYPTLELFVVDGGSTDTSVEVIREREEHIHWWVSERDEGQTDAIKKGFARATGDLIGWLNSDDVYFPGALHRVAATYDADPRASLYTGGVAVGARGNGGIRVCAYPPHPSLWFKRQGVFYLGQMATFFSRTCYSATPGLDTSLTQIMDRDILYKLIRVNPHVCRVPGMVGFIRFHEQAKSARKFVSNYADRAREISEFLARNSITPSAFKVLTWVHRFLRLVSLNYAVSHALTRRYKGLMMSDVWAQHSRSSAQSSSA